MAICDALDALGHKDGERIVRPPVVTIDKNLSVAGPELGEFLRDHKNRRQVPHRSKNANRSPFQRCGCRWPLEDQGKAMLCLRQPQLIAT